jgi:hypothetical protein
MVQRIVDIPTTTYGNNYVSLLTTIQYYLRVTIRLLMNKYTSSSINPIVSEYDNRIYYFSIVHH